MFKRDAGPIRGGNDAYYSKVSASKIYSSGGNKAVVVADFEAPGELGRRAGHRNNIENSEARQREALEIADRILHNQHTITPPNAQQQQQQQQQATAAAAHQVAAQAQLGELTSGGGSVAANPGDQLPSLHGGGDSGSSGATRNGEPGAHAEGDQSALPASSRKTTATVTQTFSNGAVKELVVDAARVAFLDVMSDGLESQDLDRPGPDHTGWWSDIVSKDGARAQPVGRQFHRPTAALATAQSLASRIEDGLPGEDDTQCKIAVLDVAEDLARTINARPCELKFKRVWPFSRHRFGIDGVETLPPEHYQYSHEHWISESIRNSSRFTADVASADFVFVDMWCYHVEWLAYIHPLGNRNTTNPEPYVRRSLNAIVKMDRFLQSKGGDFGMVHPNPVMRGLFSEEAMCEDLASVYNMVPERSSLCVWTPDSPSEGKSAIVPYLASLDIDLESDLLNVERDLFLFFRGGCGHPDPSIRSLFAAGKMLRYELVSVLDDANEEDVDAECSCDICDNHMPHAEVQDNYRRARYCPVLPSNVQSSRRLSEVILAGCIPVFIGPPFHTLPLSQFVDYASLAVFINISRPTWVNDSSPSYLQNHMVGKVWRLDDPAVEAAVVTVDTLEDAVQYLRAIPADVEASKRAAVLQERWKFYYGPVPEAQGGDGKTSALGELLMQQMCKRAAATKRRLRQAAAQGVDLADSDVQIKQASVSSGGGSGGGGVVGAGSGSGSAVAGSGGGSGNGGQKTSGGWSLFGGGGSIGGGSSGAGGGGS